MCEGREREMIWMLPVGIVALILLAPFAAAEAFWRWLREIFIPS